MTQRGSAPLQIHLVTLRNPSSFWTYDEILPTLEKRCIFPNLSMPTVAGLTPSEHQVTLCELESDSVDPMPRTPA